MLNLSGPPAPLFLSLSNGISRICSPNILLIHCVTAKLRVESSSLFARTFVYASDVHKNDDWFDDMSSRVNYHAEYVPADNNRLHVNSLM